MSISQYIEAISKNFKNGITTKVAPSLVINPEIIQQISKKLQLSFIKEEDLERTGEVCFANSPEVRPEFRTVFTSKDVLDYLYAVLYSGKFHNEFEKHLKTDLKSIPIPADIFIFCKLALSGSELQKIHRLVNPFLNVEAARNESEKIIKEIDIILLAE